LPLAASLTSGAAQAKVPNIPESLSMVRWSFTPACIIRDRPTSLIFASPACRTNKEGCTLGSCQNEMRETCNALQDHTSSDVQHTLDVGGCPVRRLWF